MEQKATFQALELEQLILFPKPSSAMKMDLQNGTILKAKILGYF